MLNEKIESRRSFIINVTYIAIVIAVLYLLVVKALPLLMPFLIAFLVAAILQKPVNAINRKIPKLSKKLIGSILVAILLILVIAIIVFSGIQITTYITSFVKDISTKFKDLPATLIAYRASLIKKVETLPPALGDKLIEFINKYMSAEILKNINMSSILTGAAGGFWSFAKNVPSIAIATIISIISCFFMVGSYNDVTAFIFAQLSPKNQSLVSDTKSAFSDTIGKFVIAYVKIVLITFTEVLISLFIMKLIGVYNGNYILLVAAVIAIVDILPVLGTGTTVAPWAVYNLIQGNVGFAIGLIIMWILISVIRQYIEPKMVGKQMGLNPIVTIMGMYLGLKLFGALGMFLVPISIIVLKALQDSGKISIWKKPAKIAAEAESTKSESEDK